MRHAQPDQLVALADAAERFGNGHIDLTRRANLQIRGVSEQNLPELHDVIAGSGFSTRQPEAEAVRNVMISPLAGIDPAELLDVSADRPASSRNGLHPNTRSGRCRPNSVLSLTAAGA